MFELLQNDINAIHLITNNFRGYGIVKKYIII